MTSVGSENLQDRSRTTLRLPVSGSPWADCGSQQHVLRMDRLWQGRGGWPKVARSVERCESDIYETQFAPLLRMQGFCDEVALDVLDRNAEKLLVLANAREKRGPDGHLLFTWVTVFRATGRRRYERELVEARELWTPPIVELTQALSSERQPAELRDQFIAVLGHDLRNPLAAINASPQCFSEASTMTGRSPS